MALVTTGFTLYVELVDRGLNSTTKSFELNSADYATALTDAADVISKLKDITDAAVKSYSISEKFAENAFVVPSLGEIENQALLLYRLTVDPTKAATQTIPAPKDSIFLATSGKLYNEVKIDNAAVIVWRALFMTGGKCFISDGEVAAALESGKRIHRKSRRG